MDVGTLGWGKLSHVPMRGEASDRAECVNELLAGEPLVVIDGGPNDWVRIELEDGYRGWVDRRQLAPRIPQEGEDRMWLSTAASRWEGVPGGMLPAGALVRRTPSGWAVGPWETRPLDGDPTPWTSTMGAWAQRMLGVPYVWGGRSSWGMDCSGLVQLAGRLCGHDLPRDASQQVGAGKEVAWGDAREDDLAFFQNASGQITHVGICLDGHQLVHASGEVRVDRLTPTGIERTADRVQTHVLSCIRRLG